MNIIIPLIILGIALVGSIIIIKSDIPVGRWLMILAFVAIIGFSFSLIENDYFMANTTKLVSDIYGDDKMWSLFVLILKWSHLMAILVVLIAPFFDNHFITKMVIFFCLPILLVNTFFITTHIESATGSLNFASYRTVGYFIEFTAALAICFIHLKDIKTSLLKRRDLVPLLLSIIGLAIISFSVYTLNILFGRIEGKSTDFTFIHRCLIYFVFLSPLVIYLFLKNKSLEIRYIACILIGVTGFIHFFEWDSFSYIFSDITRLPLHLCNTAIVIMPLCTILKSKKIFYFTYFINVLGTLFAIIFSTSNSVITSPSAIHYWINHIQAFILPLLLVALGIFKRPTMKEFKYSVIAFIVYFVVILFIDSWFLNFNSRVDYFFLNGDEIIGNFPPGRVFKSLVVSFKVGQYTMSFQPIYQSLVFVIFTAMTLVQWFIYEGMFDVSASFKQYGFRISQLRKQKRSLLSLLKGSPKSSPVNPYGTDVVNISALTKYYGDAKVPAVKKFNLVLAHGDIVGFLGRNGAGKSTVIKSLVGILPINNGKIEVFGYDVNLQPQEAKKRIGYVPDNYSLYENLTGRQYIEFIAKLYRLDTKVYTQRLDKYLKILEMQIAIDTLIKGYSHGMKQKIAIIAAMIHEPPLLVLDEPLTGLDPTSIYQIKTVFIEYAKKGNIILFSSHIIDLVEKLANKICLIQGGERKLYTSMEKIVESGISTENIYLEYNKVGS